MAVVHPEQVRGLNKLLGGKLSGYMYLNGELTGELPVSLFTAWRGNGDIEIQHGHWLPAQTHIRIQEVGGMKRDLSGEQRFSRLAARFRLGKDGMRIPHIELEAGRTQVSGRARTKHDGTITGELNILQGKKSRVLELTGTWPKLELSEPPKK
jgi:hypothetical protein